MSGWEWFFVILDEQYHVLLLRVGFTSPVGNALKRINIESYFY